MTSGLAPGRHNALTDVEGVEVGHATRDEPPWLTGVTVVLVPDGAVGAVDVRGAAPATRETDLLALENLVDEVHAVVLCGGSAYGLAAADGVMRYLEQRQVGWPVGAASEQVVPIVPAAAIFDLGRGGNFRARPDADLGYEAAGAARGGPVEEGNVGAGTGALFAGRALKGGVGTASAVAAAGTVAALVVLNAAGSALDPRSGRLWAAPLALGEELGSLGVASPAELAAFAAAVAVAVPRPGEHTVIGVVATDVALDRSEAQRLARVAHDGLARAVRPAHTLFDGDALFALSTGLRPLLPAGEEPRTTGSSPADVPFDRAIGRARRLERAAALVALCELGADCVARAVAHAVLSARSVPAALCYRDAFPSTFSDTAAPASAPKDSGEDR